jgi:hypothetical protein
MRDAKIAHIPLYPELRRCAAPSSQRVLEIFTDRLAHYDLYHDGEHQQSFPPELTSLQEQVLSLLGAPSDIYKRSST